MKLENGIKVKFKNRIEPNIIFESDSANLRYGKLINDIEGEIVTIHSSDINLETGNIDYEVEEYIGHKFPLSYFECIIPSIPIEVPKEYLVESCVVKLRSGVKLLYSNSIFYKDCEIYMTLNCIGDDLTPSSTLMGLSNQNDIMTIYKDHKCEEVLWERKECKNKYGNIKKVQQLDLLGIRVNNEVGERRNLLEILEEIKNVWNSLTDSQKECITGMLLN